MTGAEEVLLLLGADRGDVRSNMDRAAERIQGSLGRILAVSRDHWSEPWGFEDDALFLNRAILLTTDRDPEGLLAGLLEVEKELGRERTGAAHPGPRTMDIDILLFGDRIIEGPDLIVPHPRMQHRLFALAPAADVAPSMVHPALGRTILELLGDAQQVLFENAMRS